MPIPSTSPSRSTNPQSPKPKLMNSLTKKTKKNNTQIDENHHPIAPKRTKSPGVRLIGSRIYDSTNGKTCHQCRQKTMDFTALCNNVNGKTGKQCTIRFCHKCLFNRYGENAEEKALLGDWHCPKCRGKCNCSFCRKKSGQKPTGILIHTAKASGFSSVSDMLDVRGPDYVVDDVGVSPKKILSPRKKKTAIKEKNVNKVKGATSRNDGKEVSFEWISELESKALSSTADLKPVKSKKRKQSLLKDTFDRKTDDVNNVEQNVDTCKKSEKRILKKNEDDGSLDPNGSPTKKHKKKNLDVKTKDSKLTTSQKSNGSEEKSIKMNGVTKKIAVVSKNVQVSKDTDDKAHAVAEKIHTKNLVDEEAKVTVSLPIGKDSITVGSIELPSEDVGHALQFLEFCAAFGKVFEMRKGQAEVIIREIVGGRGRRRAQYSAAIQFHKQLTLLIQKDSGDNCSEPSPTIEKSSWLQAAWKCISNSKYKNALANFSTSSEGYNLLDSSKKLMLLNFLCDEVLATEKIRLWIDEENSKSLEQEKYSRDKVAAAKEKHRDAKQKMQDELAKAIIAKNGTPLTISEHEAIVSQIKIEAAEAHAQMLEAKGALPKNRPRSDAVRTEPMFIDSNGNTFWRLKSCSDELGIMLQEMKEVNGIVHSDHWLSYDKEQMSTLENFMYSRKQKKQRAESNQKNGVHY